MTANIRQWLGKGITSEAFIDQMKKNQEQFLAYYNGFSWLDEDKNFFKNVKDNKNLRCAIIAADWCGDVVHNVPVVLRIMETANISTEMFILEENEDLINNFLLYGGRSIPVVLLTDENGDVIHRWGPRPDYIQEPMAQFKALNLPNGSEAYKEKVTEVYTEIRKRYGEGTAYQQLIVDEFKKILS
ncbi:thioredoxin family protein [Camelliibacillus cellulosilyticus]|uniref:Thioredoxin family protein n=1 Tax=Camelliibacillus cellulosilyticus TaxID=2174486 RepID=A0ABV9GJB3_9BACL